MFKKASKEQCKLRLALFGVSGGGKTYSALRLATGLGKKIALIDTEHETASKYADRFDFDVCNLDNPTINNVLMAINEAQNYDVLIIDSLSHAWEELLDEVSRIAKAKFGGNTWAAWSEGTPKQKKLIKAILDFSGHIIVTMRAETNWTTTINDKGKVTPTRIGEAPRQGKNIEYEFDMLIQLAQDHSALVLKDRTGKYQDQCLQEIDEQFGLELGKWLQEGSPATKQPIPTKYDPILECSDEELLKAFKQRAFKLLNPRQLKLFVKRNDIILDDLTNLRNWLQQNDLELRIAKFLEDIE